MPPVELTPLQTLVADAMRSLYVRVIDEHGQSSETMQEFVVLAMSYAMDVIAMEGVKVVQIRIMVNMMLDHAENTGELMRRRKENLQ